MKALNATELYTSKWLVLCGMNSTSTEKNKTQLLHGESRGWVKTPGEGLGRGIPAELWMLRRHQPRRGFQVLNGMCLALERCRHG